MAKKANTIHLTDVEVSALKDTLSNEIYNLENEQYYQWQRDAFLSIMKKLGFIQDKDGFWER